MSAYAVTLYVRLIRVPIIVWIFVTTVKSAPCRTRGSGIAGAGVAAGLSCALAAARYIARMSYGLEPGDATNIAVAIAAPAAVAALVPAIRAAKADSMVALRCD